MRIYDELAAALPGLSKAVFSQPTDALSDSKLTVRPVRLRGELRYQAESIRDNKAFHRNLSGPELVSLAENELEGRYRQVLLVTDSESRQYVLRRDGGYKRTASSASLPMPGGAEAHNRGKEYILQEGENIPALVDLGVFTPDFRVVRSRYDKYRQINRFVELVDQSFRNDGGGEISILDFGCGKSYLTFILYYYFAVKKGMRTRITGYDLKTDVVDKCNEIAKKYGYVGLRFQKADVSTDALADEPIDMVVTLHACDTATDYALHYAISRGVKYIFSVPCCQHEINSGIERGGDLDLLLEHGIIKERLSALMTDAIRAAVLEDRGYRVDMIEFVDMEHSPKNLMIRARFEGTRRGAGARAAEDLREKYGFTQKLMELCEKDGRGIS